MTIDMTLVQLIVSIFAGVVAYVLSKSGKPIWRPILGFILGWFVGWGVGVYLTLIFFKGEAHGLQMHLLGTTFWMALIFSGAGVFLGRRKLKSGEASHNVILESMPEFVAAVGTNKLTTPDLPPVKMNSSTTTSHTMHAPSMPYPPTGTTVPPDIVDEDYFYGIVANELETGNKDKGLWTRLYVEHDGDEKKTKIAYIKQRVEKLVSLNKEQLAEIGLTRECMAEAQNQQSALAGAMQGLAAGGSVHDIDTAISIIKANRKHPSAEEIAYASKNAKSSIAKLFVKDVLRGDRRLIARELARTPWLSHVEIGYGETALHKAVGADDLTLVLLLLLAGADPNKKSQFGSSPYDLARKGLKGDLVRLFEA